MSRRCICLAMWCLLGVALCGRAQEIVTPEQALGRPVGTDFRLADWDELQACFAQLSDASPNVRVQTVGTAAEDRDLITAIISDPISLDRLDEIRANARRIADPRGIASGEEAAAGQRTQTRPPRPLRSRRQWGSVADGSGAIAYFAVRLGPGITRYGSPNALAHDVGGTRLAPFHERHTGLGGAPGLGLAHRPWRTSASHGRCCDGWASRADRRLACRRARDCGTVFAESSP